MGTSWPAWSWVFWAVGVALGVGGLSLLWWALFADRPKGRRRCPTCWYDMAGVPGLTCPECGRTEESERRLTRTRRRWGHAAFALLLLSLSLAAAATPSVRRDGWMSLVPNTAFIVAWPYLDAPQSRWWYPLADRFDPDTLWSWQRRLLARRCGRVLLQSSDSQLRWGSAHLLSRMGPEAVEALPLIIRAIEEGNADPHVLSVLEQLGPLAAAAAPALAAAIMQSDLGLSVEQEFGAFCAIEPDPEVALPVYLHLFENSRPRNRSGQNPLKDGAACCLARYPEHQGLVLPYLLSLLGRGSNEERGPGVYGLMAMEPPPPEALPALIDRAARESHLSLLCRVMTTLGHYGPRGAAALPAVERVIQHPRFPRIAATDTAARLRGEPESAIPRLIEILESGETMDRITAARCLGRSEVLQGEVLRALIGATECAEYTISGIAIGAIGTLPGAEARTIPVLVALLDHHNPDIRFDTAHTLGMLRERASDAIPRLRRALVEEQHASMRLAVAIAMARIEKGRIAYE